jgi:serine/threonine protein kinase
MAEVFRARLKGPEGFEKLVALKLILRNYSNEPEFVRMFVQEASLSARLDHANIVRVYEFDQVDDSYYIAMELVDGQDLRKVLLRCRELDRKLSVPEVLAIALEICKGLAFAHGELFKDSPEIVHRDISTILTLDRPNESLAEDIDGWKRSIYQAVFTDSSSDDPNSLTNLDRLNILTKLLSTLEKTNPSIARWRMYELATMYLGMVQWWMIGFHEPEAPNINEWMETYIRLLRTRPEVKLTDSSSAQEVDMLEKARTKIKTMKKGALTVESDPSGAEVLLDGISFGITPFHGEFIVGKYHLLLADQRAGKVSYWVTISPKETILKSDIAFDRAIDLSLPYPALHLPDSESHLPKSWLPTVSNKLGINTVITLVQTNTTEATQTRVGVVDLSNGQVLRECEITTKGANSSPTAEDTKDLALFVVTGGLRGNVEDVNKKKDTQKSSLVSSSTTIKTPDNNFAGPSPVPKDKQPRPWYKAWYVYAITGGVILAGAITAHVLSKSYASSSASKNTSQSTQTTANALLGVAIGGYVVSGAAFVTGTILYFSFRPPKPPTAETVGLLPFSKGQVLGVEVGINF